MTWNDYFVKKLNPFFYKSTRDQDIAVNGIQMRCYHLIQILYL